MASTAKETPAANNIDTPRKFTFAKEDTSNQEETKEVSTISTVPVGKRTLAQARELESKASEDCKSGGSVSEPIDMTNRVILKAHR